MTDVPNTGSGPIEAGPPAASARLRRLTAAAQSGDPTAQAQLAEALYASELQPAAQPSPQQVREAISRVVLGGEPPAGAGEADARMRWCRNVVALSYCGTDGDDPAAAHAGDDPGSAYLRDLFWRRA